MKSREKGKILLFCLTGALILGSGISLMFVKGPLGQVFFANGNPAVFLELALVFVWMFFSFAIVKEKRNSLILAFLGTAVFSWCHRAFLPLAVSGIYGLFLLLLGKEGLQIFLGKEGLQIWRGSRKDRILWPVMGAALWICLVCLLSAPGLGGVRLWRLLAGGLAAVLGVRQFIRLKGEWKRKGTPFSALTGSFSMGEGLALAIILTCFLLQIGRMNIALDYDSLHYGLRSPYILDNGRGIYENLGNINVVYTYPKGLEILALPLSGSASYGFVLAFNIWITAGSIFMIYKIGRSLGGRNCGLLAAALAALVPGIMNMSVTAKTDSITLLFQLIMADGLLQAAGKIGENQREEKTAWLVAVAGTCMVSYVFKPTAVVFSTALAGLGILWVVREKPVFRKGAARLAVIPALAWLGVWFRTYRMTGVPSTSVFTSIWEILGFRVRWPFAFSSIPNEGISLGFWGGILHLGERLLKMFFAPLGEDMDHVILAWGTGLIFLCLLAAVLYGRTALEHTEKKERNPLAFLCCALGMMTLLSVISIYLLWQVDGNYFMLWYALAVLGGSLAFTKGYRGRKQAFSDRFLRGLAAIFAVFQISTAALTSWAGAVGFTPVSLVHKGYYDHRAETRKEAEEAGRGQIWELLSSNPRHRVIAFGEHPDCLDFGCNVQSYYDVTGSGGNVVLVKTLDNFKEFLRYGEIEYLYAEAGHLEEGTREWDVLRFMAEDGSLTDIRYENGNLVGRVNLDETLSEEEIAAQTEEFYRNVILR